MRVTARKLTVLGLGALMTASFALAAPSAGARVSSKSACEILTDIKIDPSADPTAAGGRENAEKLAKQLKKAAKKVKGDIKKSLKTMAKYFQAVADEDTDALQDQAEAFGKATAKFAAYVAQKCISENLPDIDIPDISIPGS